MKKLVLLVVVVLVFVLGYALGRRGIGDLRGQVETLQEQAQSLQRHLEDSRIHIRLMEAKERLREVDLDVSAANFGKAKESLRRVMDRLDEAYQMAVEDEALRAELDKVRDQLKTAREDLDNLRAAAREKIEQALHDLSRLVAP